MIGEFGVIVDSDGEDLRGVQGKAAAHALVIAGRFVERACAEACISICDQPETLNNAQIC